MAALASTLVGPSAPTKLTIVGARRAVVLAPLAAGPSLVHALKSATSVPPRSSSTSPLQSTPSHSGASTRRPSKTHQKSVDFAAGRRSASSIDAARPRAPPAATGAQSSYLTRVASSVCASGLPATPRDVQLWLTTLSRTPTLSVRAGRSEFGVSPTSVASSAATTHKSVSIAAHVGGDSVNQLGRTKGSSSTRPPLPPSLKPPTLPAPPQHIGVRSSAKAQGERTRTAPKREQLHGRLPAIKARSGPAHASAVVGVPRTVRRFLALVPLCPKRNEAKRTRVRTCPRTGRGQVLPRKVRVQGPRVLGQSHLLRA